MLKKIRLDHGLGDFFDQLDLYLNKYLPISWLMNNEFLKEIQEEFLKESLSLVERFESVLLNNENLNKDLVDELFRIAHSIKGGAAAVELFEVSKLTHKFEDYLSPFRSNGKQLSKSDVSLLLEFSDTLRNDFLQRMMGQEPSWNPDSLLNKLAQVTSASSAPVPAAEEEEQPIAATKQVESAQSIQKNEGKKTVQHVKVDLTRLESIFDTIGEVVIFKNRIKSLMKRKEADHTDNEVFDQLEFLVKDLYDKALGLRMTTLQPLFQRMQRTLRDLSIQLEKDVLIKTYGEDTEIDRNLFEQLPDPLIHLIRNAIDHGIETKQERAQTNKPARATIEINSYYESGQVVIDIKDDGRGIDKEKVFSKALQNGLIPSHSKIVDYSDEQIFQFIFLPGFSTAAKVSDLSGRGVGLDVVKTTIEKFHGKISITSQKGAGSCFKLCLPLTTSLIDGISFQLGSSKFIVPNTAIVSIDTVKKNQISFSGEGKAYVNCFNEPYYALNVSDFFETSGTSEWNEKICVRSIVNEKTICFLFDKVLDQCQVVVKPLPSGQKSSHFIGAAISDDGNAQLILDLSSIYKNFLQKEQAA